MLRLLRRFLRAGWSLLQRLLRPLLPVWRLLTAPFRWLWGRWRALVGFFTDVPEDVSLTDTLGDALQSRETMAGLLAGFGEHLAALRGHLLRSVGILLLTTLLSFSSASTFMTVLAVPLGQPQGDLLFQVVRLTPDAALQRLTEAGASGMQNLQVIEPTESIGVFMRVALLAGLALAMPWIVMELYIFIAPGLMPRSRLLLLLAIPAASLLFVLGLLFTYAVMLPAAIPFLYTFGGFRAAWRPSAYFNLVTGLMFWIGAAFQMPLLLYALAAAGLIRARQLVEYWRIAVVVIAIIAAAITPTVDPVNMLLVMLPMVLLYAFSIVGAAVAQAARRSEIQRHAARQTQAPK